MNRNKAGSCLSYHFHAMHSNSNERELEWILVPRLGIVGVPHSIAEEFDASNIWISGLRTVFASILSFKVWTGERILEPIILRASESIKENGDLL